MTATDSTRVRGVAVVSLAITAVFTLTFAYRRAGIPNPFELPVYSHLILFHDYAAVAPYIGVLLLALLPQVGELGVRAATFCGRHAMAVALATAAALALGTRLVYHLHPLSLDEHAAVFQSQIFAEGHLSGQYPAALMDWLIPKFFQAKFLVGSAASGKVASVYWPGFSLLLTPFTALGVPWLLNPLIGGGTILVMHRLGLALFGSAECAGYVVLLTLASPAITINALSFYSMPAHLLLNGLYTLLLLSATPSRALLAGVLGSVALVLHNPVPHLAFALPWMVWLAFRPDRLRLLGALVLGYLPLALVLGWGWALYYDQLLGREVAANSFTPAAAASTFMGRITSVLTGAPGVGLVSRYLDLGKLWLWAVPGLVTVAAMGAWQRRRDRGAWLVFACSGLLTYLAYFTVPFDQGHGWGARYLHSAWLILPLFAAGALRTGGSPDTAPASGLARYLAACAALSLAVLTPLRALQVEQFIARHLTQLPQAAGGEPRVLIINFVNTYYGWDLVRSDPFFRDPVKVLITRGEAQDRAMMAAQFPQYRLLGSDWRGWVWGIPAKP